MCETVFVSSAELHSGLHSAVGMRDMALGDLFIIVASHIYAFQIHISFWSMDHMDMDAAKNERNTKRS